MTHFPDHEFECKCTRPDCPAPTGPDARLRTKLDAMRQLYGKPIVVTSGNRCEYWNTKQGGKPESEHMAPGGCLGADIQCINSVQRWELLNAALKVGVERVGVGATFLHIGVDSSPAHPPRVVWGYYPAP